MRPFSKKDSGFVHHEYRLGESFDYFFEVTEATYSTEQHERLPVIKDLQKIEELAIIYRLSIVSVEHPKATKEIELLDTRYREVTQEDFMSKTAKKTVPHPLSSLMQGFPETLSYRYTDEDFTEELNQAFSAYMGNQLGIFLYYKLMDVHSFQSVIDSIPAGEAIGDIVISPSEDIEVEHGMFHNHNPVRLYNRIDFLNGVKHAYFKVQTMGNVFRVPEQKMEMHTNYQMTFHVPLEGESRGLLSQGEQQESAFVIRSGEPVTSIQRQYSLTLQTGLQHSGVEEDTSS